MMGFGFLLFVNDSQKNFFKENVGLEVNQGELLAYFYLLKLISQQNTPTTQVFGDSSLVTNHLNGVVRITSLALYNLA